MRILFLNFEFGMAVTKGYWQQICYWRYWNYPKVVQKIDNFIKAQNIDVVGLVEVSFPAQAEAFKKITGMEEAGEAIYHNPFIHQGNLLLSRYPIKNYSLVMLPYHGQPRAAVKAEIETPSGAITFLITHLSLGKRTRNEQIKFLNNLCSEIKTPFILMGDFNCLNWQEELKPLVINPLLKHVNLGPTYPSWKPKRHFDHIFLSKNLAVKNAEVHNKEKFSDHLGLITEI